MNLKELYDMVPGVVADNLYEMEKATKHAQELLMAAEEPCDKDEAQKLIVLIQTRQDQILRATEMLQKSIYHIALLAHVQWELAPADGI
jgi:hypothetical protein